MIELKYLKIPGWVKFVAADWDGNIHGFEYEPSYMDGRWYEYSRAGKVTWLGRDREVDYKKSLTEIK